MPCDWPRYYSIQQFIGNLAFRFCASIPAVAFICMNYLLCNRTEATTAVPCLGGVGCEQRRSRLATQPGEKSGVHDRPRKNSDHRLCRRYCCVWSLNVPLIVWRDRDRDRDRISVSQDTRRQIAVVIDGLITGPALHALYGLLERLIPTAGGGFVSAASHLLIDTLVFDPMFVASFFCITGMLESRSLKQDVLPALRR